MKINTFSKVRNAISNVFKTNKKTFSLDGDRTKIVRTHATKTIGKVDYSVDEAVLGNKKHVVITKRDFSESPMITTTARKEKGFEDGKLVYTDTSVYYDHQPLTGQFLDSVNGGSRYYK